MSDSRVIIRFDGNGRTYHPGERLTGEYRLISTGPDDVKAVEVSVLWHTDGKGDEDLAVHDFRRISADDDDWVDPGRFSTILPNSPLSYEGAIVKLRWCVRVRVFLARDKEILGELPFRLGSVSAAKVQTS